MEHSNKDHRYAFIVRVVALCLLAAGTFLGVAPASALPAAPTGLTASGSPIPTLSWDRMGTADRYRVQASSVADFSSLIFSVETTNTTYIHRQLVPGGTFHWRVQAIDSTGEGAWTAGNLAMPSAQTPTGLRVSPGETVLPPISPPVISWDPVPGARSYALEMDDEGDGVGGIRQGDLRTNSYVWPDPQRIGDYYVRVLANFDGGMSSDWSGWVKYDVAPLPAVTATACAVELVCAPQPATGVWPSRTVQDVVFDWDPVPGAQKYEIRVARDPGFNNLVEQRQVLGTRYSPTVTYPNDSYYWQVRATNAAGQEMEWPALTSSFQRRWPSKPTLVYPPTSSTPVGDDFYYQWTPVKHASRYRLEVGPDSNFTPGTFSTCFTATTTYTAGYGSFDGCMPAQGSTYYWRVIALDGPRSVESLYSDQGHFVYDSGNVRKLAPANGTTVEVPTLRWEGSNAAQRYRVIVRRANGTVAQQVETFGLSWTPTDKLVPAEGPFSWTVIAIDADGKTSPTYPAWQFTLASSITPTSTTPDARPVVFGDTTARFPSLSWEPVANAAYYRIRMSDTPGFYLAPDATPLLNTRLAYPAVTDISSYFLRPGNLTWYIEAYDATDTLIGSGAPAQFTITKPTQVGGQGIGIDGIALNSGARCSKSFAPNDANSICDAVPVTPVLDWDPVPGAGGYMIYLFEDSDVSTPIYDPRSITTSSTRWTPNAAMRSALEDNEVNGAYYWFVRPCVSINPFINCGPDPASLLDSATNAFRKLSPPVKLLAPADLSSFDSEVTFTWEDYRTTNAAAKYAASAEGSSQSARSYRLQVSRSATITDSNAIEDVTVDQPTFTTFDKTYPEGDLWWRVQAIDEQGNRLVWSQTRKVVKATPALNLDPTFLAANERPGAPTAQPVFNTHQGSGATILRWQAHNFDATWQVDVYRNDDTTQSSGTQVPGFPQVTRQAALVLPPLPPSDQAYRWRVRRFDVQGREAGWSDFGRFFVDATRPTLLSPAPGAVMSPNGVVLRWAPLTSASTAATSYAVEIRSSNGQSLGAVSTLATGWAPMTTMATGEYTWTVTAYDSLNNVIGVSAPQGFSVDAALSVFTDAQIQAPDGTSIGKTLTSTPPQWSQS
ncbi:MAG: hypothetical protein ABIQ53_17160, partial [Terracoccus sp.]